VRSRAGDAPDQFTPDTHDDISGWLWEGPLAALIREAIPAVTDADLRGRVNTSMPAAWW
jgi:hypothetical protein